MCLATGDTEHVWKEKNRVGPIKVEKVQQITEKKKLNPPSIFTVILEYGHH
jgi:hypothetical protein